MGEEQLFTSEAQTKNNYSKSTIVMRFLFHLTGAEQLTRLPEVTPFTVVDEGSDHPEFSFSFALSILVTFL